MNQQPNPVALKVSPWPRWTVARGVLLLLAVLSPLVHAVFWTGHGRLVFVCVSVGCTLLAIVALLVLVALAVVYIYSYLVPDGRRLCWHVGVGIFQFGLVLLLFAMLLFTGSCLESVSLWLTQQRAKEAMAALELYRLRHGAFPESFAAVEEETGKPFPRPTVASQFEYALRPNGYDLGFETETSWSRHWRYDPKAKRWQIQ
jgi:hypothetical protein